MELHGDMEASTFQERYDGIAQRGDAHRTDIADNDYQPQAMPVLAVHGRGHKSAEDDVEGMEGEEEDAGHLDGGMGERDGGHGADAEHGPGGRERNMVIQLMPDAG